MSIINETKSVPFNTIEAPEEENVRQGELEDIPALADLIKEQGLLQNLVVTNGGKGDRPYRVVAGFRRYAALKLLKWGDKPVGITLVAPAGRVIKNLIENIGRQEVKAADLAQRLHDLERGDYPVEKGETARKYTKEELATQLGLSASHVTNLIRAHANLADPLRKAWQKHDLPQNLVFKCAGLTVKEEKVIELKDEKGKKLKDDEGNVKTKTIKVTVPDEGGQEKLLSRWQKAKETETLAQKGEKKDKAEGGGGDEGGEGDEVNKDGKRPGKKQFAEFIEKATAKFKSGDYKEGSVEMAALKGKLDAVKWAAGERDSLAPR